MHVKTSVTTRPPGPGVERLVGRDERQPRGLGQPHETRQIPLLRAVEVTLDLDEAAVAAEDPGQPIEDPAGRLAIAPRDGVGQRAVAAAGETHEPARVGLELVERDPPRALGGAELQTRDQPAEVAVAVAVLDEHRQPRAVGQRQLAADQRADAGVARRHGGIAAAP